MTTLVDQALATTKRAHLAITGSSVSREIVPFLSVTPPQMSATSGRRWFSDHMPSDGHHTRMVPSTKMVARAPCIGTVTANALLVVAGSL